jgi:replication factor C subunit 1
LKNWNERFHDTGNKGKGKKQNDSTAKKAVLLSGPPGIGKTTSAKLVSKMLGFQAIEVAYFLCKFVELWKCLY